MSARDELAGVVSASLDSIFGTRDFGPATQDYKLADALIAAGWVKHRTITTTDEVDALPDGSIIRTCFGHAVTIYRAHRILTAEGFHHVVQHGPATVLYEPEQAP